MHLLITRPSNQASRTANRLKILGYECTVEPLLIVEEVNTKLPQGSFDAIIITSSNALPAIDRYWLFPNRAKIPVITTGDATKSEIQALGFKNCQSVNGSARDLADNFSHFAPNANDILYPCAQNVSLNLVQLLTTPARSCTSWITYKTNNVQKWSSGTLENLKCDKIDGILLYSSKTARVFADLWVKNCTKHSIPAIFALSENICSVLPPKLAQRCSFPTNPNENDLFQLISKSTIKGRR